MEGLRFMVAVSSRFAGDPDVLPLLKLVIQRGPKSVRGSFRYRDVIDDPFVTSAVPTKSQSFCPPTGVTTALELACKHITDIERILLIMNGWEGLHPIGTVQPKTLLSQCSKRLP
jgi:hypothetical protein